MKIRHSLRLYFLAVMLLVGSMTIIIMSGIAISYFFSGMGAAMEASMRTQAHQLKPVDNHPMTLGEMTVASRWQDLPLSIRHIFKENEVVPNKLLKHVEGIPLITPPKAGYFVLKVVEKNDITYVSLQLPEKTDNTHFRDEEFPHIFSIIFTALGALCLFSATLFGILRTVSTPIENLREWTKSLDKDQLKQPVPHFQFSELNSLASIVQSSLSSVQDSLDRETQFLGYASHELRTPIAVIRSNTELLRKMVSRDVDKARQDEVLKRIERTVFTMTDLTETLLWLNRREDRPLQPKTIALGELITQIRYDLSYLLQGKQVNVLLESDDSRLDLPLGLCRIVITNLIRNAFQHTYHGEVEIKQIGKELQINNYNLTDNGSEQELGFGLGLELTERLIKRYGWHYENITLHSGMNVLIEFRHQ
ncbi:sensor histidine kinase [Vibrio breoganii]|uniref:sensor histidine kinase n=1 Tax=Vibrio breoganii TaxID=553239 RepID=UPI000C82D79E|nr:histidine kinase [Vibrio breoganii]PML15521.1 histidine kinase [Vibrio breoganii]PMM11819.1 histidine kinase [Vibrio breoganii]TKG17487.1 HAMP domain-containing histidine kinase [Vibrio breoganii]